MPQPLSSRTPVTGYSLGNSYDQPLTRPEFAPLAMAIISGWALVETQVGGAFVKMVGESVTPAVEIFLALQGAGQQAALQAAAKTCLDEQGLELFEALLALHASSAKERNRVAHWIWGTSPALPNDALAADPRDFLVFSADLVKYQLAGEAARQERWKRQFAPVDHSFRTRGRAPTLEERAGWPSPDDVTQPTIPEIPPDRILVYTTTDFHQIRARIDRLGNHFLSFSNLLGRRTLLAQPTLDGELLRQLSTEPDVAEVLARRRERRRNNPQSPPPQPEQPTPPSQG